MLLEDRIGLQEERRMKKGKDDFQIKRDSGTQRQLHLGRGNGCKPQLSRLKENLALKRQGTEDP